jgi:hypothetical protein
MNTQSLELVPVIRGLFSHTDYVWNKKDYSFIRGAIKTLNRYD